MSKTLKKIFIAVVEDDPDDQDFLCTALEDSRKDISISRFNNGNDFLKFLMAAQFYPSLVITDIRMPIATGWDVINHLKSDIKTNDIPVVVLSTSSNEEDMNKASRLGAAAYYVKPYSPAEYDEIADSILKDLGAE